MLSMIKIILKALVERNFQIQTSNKIDQKKKNLWKLRGNDLRSEFMTTYSRTNEPNLISPLNSLYLCTAIFSIIIIFCLHEKSSGILEDFFDYQLKSENIFLYSETDLFTY